MISDLLPPASDVASWSLEPLEPRRHLSAAPWAPFPVLLGQDQVVKTYPWLTGAGQSVAVVDTGVDYRHPAFDGGFGAGHIISVGYDFADHDADPMDGDGHGTGVAGLLGAKPYAVAGVYNQGLLPKASLLALRENSGDSIRAALDWVISHRARYNIVAVNLTDFDGPGFDHQPHAYDAQLAALHAAGVFIATPVGNGGPDLPIEYPSTDPNVFGAGGITQAGQIDARTQVGPGLDVLGPGADVTLPYFLPANPPGQQEVFVNYGQGTSWATPYVTAAAAYVKQIDPAATPDQILQVMIDSGVPTPDPAHGGVYPRLSLIGSADLAYRRFDDRFQGNTTAARATPLAFQKGKVAAGKLKLLVGKDDYYSFVLNAPADVSAAVAYAGGSAFPVVELRNSALKRLATVPARGATLRLGAGAYYVRLSTAKSLLGTYALTLSAVTTKATAAHAAAPVPFATTGAQPFSQTRITRRASDDESLFA